MALTPAEQELTAKVMAPQGLEDDSDGNEGEDDDDTHFLSQELSPGLLVTYLIECPRQPRREALF